MKVKFVGDEGIMSVNATKPTPSSGTIQNVFNIFSTVANCVGQDKLANVSALIGALSIGVTDSISISGTTATFDVNVNDKDAAEIDLREGGNSTYAHKNGYRGVIFKVAYIEDPAYRNAEVTITANITYQVFLNTDRTAYWKTGTSTIIHTVDFN